MLTLHSLNAQLFQNFSVIIIDPNYFSFYEFE